MAKPPDAFLSYTRFDDEYDGGAISELCQRLELAVRAVTGTSFRIFQDINGIGIGEHWPDKLDQMLDEARFFIPIFTPSYFMSKACREELEKFLRVEAKRERNDLVLPIYSIECEVLTLTPNRSSGRSLGHAMFDPLQGRPLCAVETGIYRWRFWAR